jgi:membrane protein implicated in regulation of membrane protease activity
VKDFWDAVGDNLWGVWLAIAMLLGVLELFSLDLVLLMLATGAIAGMVVDLAGLGVPFQVIAAAAMSVAMLAFVRPAFVKRLHSGPDLKQGFESLIGEEGFTVAEITGRGGQVKVGGEIWTALPYDETAVIPIGARVRVYEIRGATAYVDEIPQLGA